MAVLINCPAILCAWNEKHWLEPELIEQMDLRQVKLVLHLPSDNVVKNGGNSSGNKLTERQEIALRLIIEDRHITANEIVKTMSDNGDVAKRTIERELALLKIMGILPRNGGPRNGEWVMDQGQTQVVNLPDYGRG